MKRRSIIVSIILLVVFSFSCIAEEETLIGRVNDWPPLYYQEKGRWMGISVDAYEALTREAGIQLELKQLPWSRALAQMGREPLMVAYLTPTKERRETMHFIGPHHNEVISLALSTSYAGETIENLDDLVAVIKKAGKKVGYQRDVMISDAFNRRIKNDPDFRSNFHLYESHDNTVKMIVNGRLLGYIGTLDSIAYRLRTKSKNDPIQIHPFRFSQTKVYVGVSKSISATTLKKLMEANDRLIKNGTWNALIKKWSVR